jgi:hypothetical protein
MDRFVFVEPAAFLAAISLVSALVNVAVLVSAALVAGLSFAVLVSVAVWCDSVLQFAFWPAGPAFELVGLGDELAGRAAALVAVLAATVGAAVEMTAQLEAVLVVRAAIEVHLVHTVELGMSAFGVHIPLDVCHKHYRDMEHVQSAQLFG